ncbi:hypothetical protein ATO12_02950 [Aquimarina atlantica]|uniref:DUF4177 domain-containing protein n=1 Tax=Aquimarina atlantica TaxID=1317122 RepID=A0A023C0H6_9FLAO|nr:hypothetical protein [Aquimarina atlantica]EZH75760.1 hypothetical protein ATO12_02950 [Aquimarina atlantica]
MKYKVVPFVASIDNKKTSKPVAEQLEELIQHYNLDGWKYVGLESVTTYVQPNNGCFGFGGSPGFTTSRQMIVFNK